MSRNKVILVTGAPRTATTPVGNVLASTRRSLSLYEPFGMTGLREIKTRFPMLDAETDLTAESLNQIVDNLARRRSGGLRSQQRGDTFSISRMMFGSRTLHSFRLARMQPWTRNVIWKDPHAIMLVPDLVDLGVDVVVTARRALAHAASFQRLGWVSRAREIYPRWSQRFGPCTLCEDAMADADQSVISAAVLWRMCYLPLIRTEAIENVHLITSDSLMSDEKSTYNDVFTKLNLSPSKKTASLLEQKKDESRSQPKQNVTHDWNRTARAANSYWKDILSSSDVQRVSELTEDVEKTLYADRD